MRKVTVSYTFRGNATVPMIRLRGKWLQNAGFDEGTPVEITVAEGRLTLTVTKPQVSQ
jgi:type I toxin-antitoxin system toxin SymE